MKDGGVARPKTLRRSTRCLAVMILAFSVCADETPDASASFTNTVAATTTVGAHGLTAPTLSCVSLGVLSATLTSTAPADTSQSDVYGSGFLADGYELLRGTSSGGPYSVRATLGLGTTSYADSLSAGDYYYVVRSTKHQWKGALSNERHVHAVLFLVATCS